MRVVLLVLLLPCKSEVLSMHERGKPRDAQVADAPEDEAHAAQSGETSPGEFIAEHTLESGGVRTTSIRLDSSHGLLHERSSILEKHSLCCRCLEHIYYN